MNGVLFARLGNATRLLQTLAIRGVFRREMGNCERADWSYDQSELDEILVGDARRDRACMIGLDGARHNATSSVIPFRSRGLEQ